VITMIAVAGILCHGNNDKAAVNELSASHIAAQSPVDNSPAITNMALAFGDWNATKPDGEGPSSLLSL